MSTAIQDVLTRALGYSTSRTTTGHLRFVHPRTGKVFIGPSGKQQGDISRKIYAELQRYAATLDNV